MGCRPSRNIYKDNVKNGRSFDIVTMDVDMPIMDGRKCMQLIRAYERENNLKPCMLIIVSANCTESEIAACLSGKSDEGPGKADDFIKKPASIDDFYKSIIGALDKGEITTRRSNSAI